MGIKMEKYIPRYFSAPDHSFFLFGPRGTGKTTYLKESHPDALWIDLLRPDVFRMFAAKPERIIEIVRGNPGKKTVIIDEIQKLPDLLSAVHLLIREDKGRRFIITGSSSRKLKRSGVDLLSGRILYKTLHPFLFSEIAGAVSFEEMLEWGTLPIVLASGHRKETLETYVSLYVREEVHMEGLVRNIGHFSRFLEAISFSHASVLNISNVARECGVERKTVEGYVQILEDILLSFRLPVFSKKSKRTLVSHPKFYFFDTGVYRTLRPKGPLDEPGIIGGAALEGLVAQHLRAWSAYRKAGHQIFFWRSRKGLEVDFVLYGPKGITAIEVKNTSRIRPEDLNGLKEFQKDYPGCRMIFLYRGEYRLLKDRIQCIPCNIFLKDLSPEHDMSVT